eukprot:1146100-Pelagomonas_calceolata.AAC.3
MVRTLQTCTGSSFLPLARLLMHAPHLEISLWLREPLIASLHTPVEVTTSKPCNVFQTMNPCDRLTGKVTRQQRLAADTLS